jgi:Leucine-rich repeat (LRR) protein
MLSVFMSDIFVSLLRKNFFQTTFITLKQIVKLDLSKNMLVELPENFGEMTQLRHLDLYANKVNDFFYYIVIFFNCEDMYQRYIS